MRVVCFGDSITAGQHLPEGKAWPSLIPDHEITAHGVPGDTTRLGLERFPRQVQESGADVVVIQFGHNDCNRWQTDAGANRVSPAAFHANLCEMVDRARLFGIKPVLCSMTPTERSSLYQTDARKYNALITDVAESMFVPLVPIAEEFRGLPGDSITLADGLHLSRRGHWLYAQVVAETLARLDQHATVAA